MDNSEKEILETLKNFDTKYLLTKDSYVEINLQGNCYQAFILGLKSNDNFEIYISRNTQGDASLNMLSFFGENLLSKEYYFRKNIFNTKRNGLNLEIIDYAGYTEYKAENYLHYIIHELKDKKLNSLDLFLLVINPFYVRYPSDTKNYIKLIKVVSSVQAQAQASPNTDTHTLSSRS